MRHRIAGKKLSRDIDHRKMLLKNLSASVIIHEAVNTTLAKAKFVKPYVEGIITSAVKAAKSQDKLVRYNAVKKLKAEIGSDGAVRKLLEDISQRFADVKGGYARIVKTGNRDGDNAKTARIELTVKKSKSSASAKQDTKKTEAETGEKKKTVQKTKNESESSKE